MTKYLYFVLFSCLFYSCDIINPEEDIPAFIEIESFTLNATPNTGSNDEDITEGWIFVDNVLIGAFSPGKPFPVLAEGEVEVFVEAGIHENGFSASTVVYPYYTRYSTTVQLTPGEITTINPEFQYRENIDFFLIEEFENSTLFVEDIDGDLETSISFESGGSFDGLSGIITLTEENPSVNVATALDYILPSNSPNDTFLEISFKTEAAIAIGLRAIDDFGGNFQLYANGLNTTPEWKKIYINLQEVILNNPASSYQVGFGAILPLGLSEATIMVDNIKLLHFK